MMKRSGFQRYYSPLAIALLAALVLLGCGAYNSTRREYLERMTDYLPVPSRPVIVIPGYGNSKLWDPVEKRVVWGHPRNLTRTRYEDDLDLPIDIESGTYGRDRLVPNGRFAGARATYNIAFALSSSLRKYGGYIDGDDNPGAPNAVYTFAYDWRLSAVENSRRLGEMIDTIRSRHLPNPPEIDIVAHSAGGLIALAYVKLGGLDPSEPTERIDLASKAAAAKVANLTLISVPQRGTNETVRALARGEKLVFRELPPSMMATFPSIPEMLPADGKIFVDTEGREIDFDVWEPKVWERLGFSIWEGEPSVEQQIAFELSLENARRLRDALQRPVPEGIRETVIAGDCVPTAMRVLLRSDLTLAFYPGELREEERDLLPVLFDAGDGSIETRSALNGSGSQLVFCSDHHGMASDPNVQRTMIRELLREPAEARREASATPVLTGAASMETPNPR